MNKGLQIISKAVLPPFIQRESKTLMPKIDYKKLYEQREEEVQSLEAEMMEMEKALTAKLPTCCRCYKTFQPKALCPNCESRRVTPIVVKCKGCKKDFTHLRSGRIPLSCETCRPIFNKQKKIERDRRYKARIAADPIAAAERISQRHAARYRGGSD